MSWCGASGRFSSVMGFGGSSVGSLPWVGGDDMGKLLSFIEVPDNGVLFLVLFLVGTAIALGAATLIADKWFRR